VVRAHKNNLGSPQCIAAERIEMPIDEALLDDIIDRLLEVRNSRPGKQVSHRPDFFSPSEELPPLGSPSLPPSPVEVAVRNRGLSGDVWESWGVSWRGLIGCSDPRCLVHVHARRVKGLFRPIFVSFFHS